MMTFLFICLGATNAVPVICSAYRPNLTHRGLFWPLGIVPVLSTDQPLAHLRNTGLFLTWDGLGLKGVAKPGLILRKHYCQWQASIVAHPVSSPRKGHSFWFQRKVWRHPSASRPSGRYSGTLLGLEAVRAWRLRFDCDSGLKCDFYETNAMNRPGNALHRYLLE